MNKVEYYWNMVHYYLFIWQSWLYKVLDFVNPFSHFFKIPMIRRFYANNGVDNMNEYTERKIFTSTNQGLNMLWAGINLGGLIVAFEYALFNIIQHYLGESKINIIWENGFYIISFIATMLVIPTLINYFLIFKDGRYKTYFKQFEKMDRSDKLKNGWMCGIFNLVVWTFFVLSFCLLP